MLKQIKLPLFLLVFLLPSTHLSAKEEFKLWYENPAQRWVEALPVGNGSIGAMTFGGVYNELIQLNEATLWSGGPQKNNINPGAHQFLKPLRKAISIEDYKTADELCRKMQGNFSESFLPMCDLEINQYFDNKKDYTNYYRELNLNTAIAATRFSVNGVKYSRELFVSAPDSIMVLKISADKAEKLTLDLMLRSKLFHTISISENKLTLSGKAPAHVDPNYYNTGQNPILQSDPDGCNGMRFQTTLQVITDKGTVVCDTSGVHIKNATSILVLLSAATSYNGMFKCPDKEGKNEKLICENRLKQLEDKKFDFLKNRHIADYKSYYDRVKFSLTDTTNNSSYTKLPSDIRLKLYSLGNYDPGLETLYYQYGRYLLISSSRIGKVPANLQGIWNKELRPPWSSNYTININTEMNYWPAEQTNLSEMHLSLLSWIKDLSKQGETTAKEFYNARGWVAHHNSDIWGLTTPVGNRGDGNPVWANWYMGGNWLSRHLWEHYQFTQDVNFLKNEAYPVMKKAALFTLDWLVEKNGHLITSPSTSPENLFVHNKEKYSVTEGSTMDMVIIRDLFSNLIKASEILNFDKKFRRQLIAAKNRLLPYQIGSKGQLLEWNKEFTEQDPYHRHVSHLFGLHPSNQISPITTPELAKAAHKTLELRGDGGTGWSKAWKINFAARLFDGNHAHKMIRELLTYVNGNGGGSGGTYPNFFDAHPPFQIDGNFGAVAGITEMLLQSQNGEIHLLPALPTMWKKGKIEGLKARGNFEIDIVWENHKLDKAVLTSNNGGFCTIRTNSPVKILEVEITQQITQEEYFLTKFRTVSGKSYTIQSVR